MSDSSTAQHAQVVLKPKKARPFFARHPWVLRRAIDRVDDGVQDGDVVDLLTDNGRFIATGLYNSQSRIAVRLYSWDAEQALEGPFWAERIRSAAVLRQQLGRTDSTEACRVVFSEADGLSGLIVDRYADYLVAQVSARVMDDRLELILDQLEEQYQPRGIYVRGEKGMERIEGFHREPGFMRGAAPDTPIRFSEHGLMFEVDMQRGQKTGFYLDQRDNRFAAANYMSGRRVLDVFCYSGGFSIAADKLGHASSVIGIDSSRPAIDFALRHQQLNEAANCEFRVAKAFPAVEQMVDAGEQFDAIILDPPKFSRTRHQVNEALRAYHRINRQAVELLSPSGILVTCSCSGGVLREDFIMMLAGVAEKSGRTIQVLEQRGASSDHPVRATCLENEYLKCFICRVE